MNWSPHCRLLNGETATFSLEKQLKSWAVLSCFPSCSLSHPLDGPAPFWCREADLLNSGLRMLCSDHSESDAVPWAARNGLCMKQTSHPINSPACLEVLMALDNVQSNYMGAIVFMAIICLLGNIVHVRLYSLWQVWPVIFQMINSSTLSKYFWLWLHSWTEVRNTIFFFFLILTLKNAVGLNDVLPWVMGSRLSMRLLHTIISWAQNELGKNKKGSSW